MIDERRLKTEAREIGVRFPSYRLVRLRNGDIAWTGALTTRYGNTYEIVLVYPSDYPHSSPKIYPQGETVASDTHHRFRDGSICTHVPEEWSPNMSAVTAVGWAAAWFHAYDTWKRVGVWPGQEA